MNAEQLIGMIQPLVPCLDNSGPQEDRDEPEELDPQSGPELYGVGCIGQIEECKLLPGGRFALALLGVTRFRVARELPSKRGYRRLEVDVSEFAADLLEMESEDVPEDLLSALTAFGERYEFSFDLERLRALPRTTLVNGLAMSLPFVPAEKQALLEADPRSREEILSKLLEMGVDIEAALEPKVEAPN